MIPAPIPYIIPSLISVTDTPRRKRERGPEPTYADDAQVCLGLFNWPSLPKGSLAIP